MVQKRTVWRPLWGWRMHPSRISPGNAWLEQGTIGDEIIPFKVTGETYLLATNCAAFLSSLLLGYLKTSGAMSMET